MVESGTPDGRTSPDSPAPEPRTARRRPEGTGGAGAAALAVAALAVGVLACGFSWMFFIQGWILAAGAMAVLLGALGGLVARRGAHSPTLAVAGAVLGALAIVA